MTTYQCTKCGKVSSDKSKVCESTKKVTSFFVCDSCNKHTISAESVCKPVEVSPSFFCGKCGTSGSDKKKLCEPLKV